MYLFFSILFFLSLCEILNFSFRTNYPVVDRHEKMSPHGDLCEATQPSPQKALVHGNGCASFSSTKHN